MWARNPAQVTTESPRLPGVRLPATVRVTYAIEAADCTLAAMGVDSLALVRFIDAVESELQVLVELDGDLWLRDLDSIAGYISGLLAPTSGG